MTGLKGAILAIAVSWPALATAQADVTEPAARPAGIEDIVVTARRTTERLQTTPVAVTAISAATLDRAQINDVSQVQQLVPNISFGVATAQPGSATIGLRGQSSTDALLAIDQAVGLYLDGVYIARSSGALLNMVDVERAEVLRGPQGTLFGRNTTGGAINLVSKMPTNEFEGSLRLRYGNYDTKEATAVANLPIVDNLLAARIAYQHSDHKGYAVNQVDGSRVGADNVDFVRGIVRLGDAGLPVRLTVAGDFTDRKTSGQISNLRGTNRTPPPGGAAAAFNATFGVPGRCAAAAGSPACFVSRPGDQVENYTGLPFFRPSVTPGLYGNARTWGVSMTAEIDISDSVSFKAINAYRDLETHSLSDNDGTPYLLSGGVPGIATALPGLTIGQGNHIWQNQWSHEAQLSGRAFSGDLTWIVGGFYFHEEGTDLSINGTSLPASITGTPEAIATANAISVNWGEIENSSQAAYGQFTYELVDGVRVTAGTRYTKDRRGIVNRNGSLTDYGRGPFSCTVPAALRADSGLAATSPGFCRSNDQVATFDYWSYTFGPDWQVSKDLFLYAKTSRAFRAGGWNTRALLVGARNDFGPERVTDYEVGAKLDLFDRKLRFNVAAFHTKYDDIQRQIQGIVINPVTGLVTLSNFVQNAAKARINGVEVEIVAAPIENLRLNGSIGYLDAKFTEFVDAAGNDLTDTPFSLAPKKTIAFGADYTIPAGDASIVLHGDFYHKDKQFGTTPPPFTGRVNTARMPGYNLVNGSVTMTLEQLDLDVQAFVRNVFDKRYVIRVLAQEHSLGWTATTPGDPRTYGVSVTKRF